MDEVYATTSFAPIFNNQKGSDSNDPITVETHTTYTISHKTYSKQDIVKLLKSTPKLRLMARTSMIRSGRANRDCTKNLTPNAKLDGISVAFVDSHTPSSKKIRGLPTLCHQNSYKSRIPMKNLPSQ